jgi:hypothetical protein
MVVGFDHGTLEPTLSDVARRCVLLVKAPGVGHGQRLEDAADVLPRFRLQNQVEMIAHKAISKESEGVTLLGLRQGVQKGLEVIAEVKDGVAIIATIEGVVHQTVTEQARLSSPPDELTGAAAACQRKNELTPLFRDTIIPPARLSSHAAELIGRAAACQQKNELTPLFRRLPPPHLDPGNATALQSGPPSGRSSQ